MKKIPLDNLHNSLGANFGDVLGWTIPLHYGDEQVEYRAVREDVGIIDLSSRGKLKLSGKDHIKFLQGMLTNDVVKLEEGSGMYATVLTVKGRMISDMRVYKDKDCLFFDLEPGLNEKVSELLTKFRLSYKAEIDDITETTGLISLQGPKAGQLIEILIGEKLPLMEQYDFIVREVLGHEISIVSVNRTGELGFDLYVQNEGLQDLWDILMEKGSQMNIKPIGHNALNTLRIEAGIPIYGLDMDENNIPIEAGLWDALDFEKGCYVGQEVVARIKWRGHVNWHLLGLESEGQVAPNIGAEIFSGDRRVGRITSSTISPILNKAISLGYIRREFKDSDTEVVINSNDSGIKALVKELPFYTGSFSSKNNSANS